MPKRLNMQSDHYIPPINDRKTLKDFIPLVVAFFVGLVALSIYQNLRLYFSGVLDSILNKSFLLLVLHHIGFTAIVSLLLAFLFNYLENKKSNSGFKAVRIILLILLGTEGLLIAYFVQNYEILGIGIYGVSDSENIRFFMLPIVLMILASALIFHYTQKITGSFYNLISNMYPFTIILFGLFLATLNSAKKPINENKTQHLAQSIASNLFDFNTYNATEEFPLLQKYQRIDDLSTYFNMGDQKPNITIIVVEGLGAEFIGDNARFGGFTPNLDSLANQSLYWKNFVSNTGAGFAALPSIIGSLPFGKNGFSNVESSINRNTLYSILKKNGYTTSFNYGGNSALNHFDRFLEHEQVDVILDKNSFGDEFQLQKEDAAGVSLGYPDNALFKKWSSQTSFFDKPKLEVFLTLSSKNPYLIPNKEKYERKVDQVISESLVNDTSKRLVSSNKEIFASLIYTDEAISNFLKTYRKLPQYHNTIFIITGSHNLTDLPQKDDLGRYRVPFIISSPLLKSSKSILSLASHADVAPSILGLLDATYNLEVPQQVSWLGRSLIDQKSPTSSKQIPLFRDKNNIQDYIQGNHYISEGNVYEINKDLSLHEVAEDYDAAALMKSFQDFKSVNRYVTENNKLIPSTNNSETLVTNFSKTDMIWIESVFNGKDVDKAYNTARKLAFDEDLHRSLLLGKYILSQTPRHADTEILMGRIYSWQKDFDESEKILKEVIRKYPKYDDGYAALLDTYFWANTNEKAIEILELLQYHQISNTSITEKIKRAKQGISKETALLTNIRNSNETK